MFWQKLSQNKPKYIGAFLGYFEKHHFKVKTAVTSFWVTFVKIWATFYSNIDWSYG